jgi:hypothetical protein
VQEASERPERSREAHGERPRSRRGEAAERPRPPWGSFPLSELAIFVGAVMLLIGFFAVSGPRQATLLVTGFVVASLGALEVSIREHFAGYRSHTLLLAGVPAVIVLGLLFYLGPDSLTPPVRVLIGGAVYAGSAWLLVAIFRARSGGRAFRLKAPRRR